MIVLYRRLLLAFGIFGLSFFLPIGALGVPNTPASPSVKGEKKDEKPEEVFLTFNYRNLLNKVFVTLYDDGTFYLPVSGILESLKIPHNVNLSPPVISGSYLNSENKFELNFKTHTAQIDSKKRFSFNASSMRIREIDYYVSLDVLRQVFDLNFSVDFNNLVLKLETPHQLPIVAEFERQRKRSRQDRFELKKNYYPLKFGRNRKKLAGGFLDYSIGSTISSNNNLYSYNLKAGGELLGGDIQGSLFGNHSKNNNHITTQNLRWRYGWKDNPYITQAIMGQTRSDGPENRSFTGIRLTNDPIESRFIYDEYEIEGTTTPGSEVELYFNETLYDYREIKQNGRYRFLVPLTYGTSRLKLKIYDPAGGVHTQQRRLQVPYNFVPTDKLIYHFNAGQLESPIFGNTRESNIVQGDISYGVSNWLTQKLGVEYLQYLPDQSPLVYSTTSARLFKEYLVNVDLAPTAFYRINANAVYPSSASWDIAFSHYPDAGPYNILGNDQEISGSVFLPFSILEQSFNIRFFGNHNIRNDKTSTRYNLNLNTRLNSLNLGLRYAGNKSGVFTSSVGSSSALSTYATYYTGRRPSLPKILRNLFLRGEFGYDFSLSKLDRVSAQISRNVFKEGRIQASFSRNFTGGFNLLTVGFTIDFNYTRSSSTVRYSNSGTTFNQNIRGSIGYDDNQRNFRFSNRQHVERAGAAVRMYVDRNNSGNYDTGDDIVKDDAIRLGQAGTTEQTEDGMIYVSQLQPYKRINMEINKSAIQNPLLVPEIEKFSFVTDPNQYKAINIPFYMSGVISGKVTKLKNGQKKAQPGLRIYLESEDGTFKKEMRTFNDGSFYAYEIPPGSYTLHIDPKQLKFLNSSATPETMHIKVKPTAEGDFVENLNFILKPKSSDPSSQQRTQH